jgi:hypothetical protein
MPLQNRVTPFGSIETHAARGALMGNRGGRLHADDKTLGPRRWVSARWIVCRTAFRGRRREVMGPGYTELFFLDEATALAAGHRPCFECRREDALRFARAWGVAHGLEGSVPADAIDRVLQRQRTSGAGEAFREPARRLPTGAMYRAGDRAMLVVDGAARPWSHSGYGPKQPLPDASVPVLTPPGIIAALKCGYEPGLDASARDPR